ncbi:MAG: GNAT family N-acetyltransferase [Aggregatilineales bacterium]
MIIRPAKDGDAQVIGQLWELLIAYHRELDPASIPPPAADGAARYAGRVLRTLSDDSEIVFVAEIDEQIGGYVMGMIVDMLPETFEYQRGGLLADIYVDDAYRSRGVGEALVRALKNWLYGRGVMSMEWHVASQNAPGIAFWQKMGGREVMIRMQTTLTYDDADDNETPE